MRGGTATTLEIVPTRWFSWDVTMLEASRPIAGIATSWWRERGTLTIHGTKYHVSREGTFSGDFVLEGADGVLARANKPSLWRREFAVRHDGRHYMLRPRSMFGRTFVLLAGSSEIGSVAPKNAFTRKGEADLPNDLPIAVRAFIVWLTLISWRRSQGD